MLYSGKSENQVICNTISFTHTLEYTFIAYILNIKPKEPAPFFKNISIEDKKITIRFDDAIAKLNKHKRLYKLKRGT